MVTISPELEAAILRRVDAEHWDSPEHLLRAALAAFVIADGHDDEWLEQQLLEGLEGEDIEVTPEDWARIRREGLAMAAAKMAK